MIPDVWLPSLRIVDQSPTRAMWALALPVLLEQFLVILVAFVDQWLAGVYLQQAHLAAIGFIWYALWAIPTMFSLVATGTTALVARFVGAKQPRDAQRVVDQSMGLGMLICVATMAGVAWFMDDLLRVMKLEGDAAQHAAEYLWIMLPLVPAIMVEEIGLACLRGAGDTRSGLWVRLAVNAINLALGAALVTGSLGLPRLGWKGLAIASAAGYGVGGVIVTWMLWRGRAGMQATWAILQPDVGMQRRILNVGVPGGIDAIATVVIHLWFLSIINGLGELPAAAHGLAVRIEALSYLPGAAFLVAAATMTGQSLGAGEPQRAVQSALLCLAWGGGIMAVASGAMYWRADSLTAFFLSDQNVPVAAEAAPLLRIVALSIPAFAVLMILSGALRGAGDTRFTLIITFAGLLFIRIPLAYYWATDVTLFGSSDSGGLRGLAWGVQGAWYAMLVDIALRGTLTLVRFLHGGWQRLTV